MPLTETTAVGNDICDNEEEEANVTVIPMPSTLSLVTAETSSTDDLNSIAAQSSQDNLVAPFADFEDEIVGKVIRNNQPAQSHEESASASVINLPTMPSLPLSVALPQTPDPNVVLPTVPVQVLNPANKKRHKLDAPLQCEYCNNTYTDRHRYEVHVRYHTGETPFKCPICGKGFRDDRKMRLHVARHNGTLNNKCHLCPRSFEGPKALQKHLQAHEMGRYVKPKVIMNADGSTSMALPTESGAGGPGSGTNSVVNAADVVVPQAASSQSVIQPQLASVIGSDGQPQQVVAIMPAPLQPNESTDNSIEAKAANLLPSGSTAVATTDDGHGTISLSMDDLMQYAQPVPDSVIHDENGLEDKLTAGACTTKFVQLNMDEFTVKNNSEVTAASAQGHSSTVHHEDQLHNDSGEFPDLLDSESNLESLSFASASRPKSSSDSLKVHEDQESGLTFATLSGVKPVYPDLEADNEDSGKSNMVVARKSAAVPVNKPATQQVVQQQQQQQPLKIEAGGEVNTDGNLNAQVKTEDLVSVLANEAISQLSKQIKLPAGTCLVPADAKCEPTTIATTDQGQLELISTAVQNQNNPSNPMTITIQYKIYPDSQSEPQKVAVQRDLVDIISEAPAAQPADAGHQAETTPVIAPNAAPIATSTPVISKSTTKVKPVGVDMDPLELPAVPVQPPPGPDPAKETRKVISASGKEFDVPTIVTSGYDLDKLMCTFCTKVFKNDKTLMSHMLHHFGVTPKMASCPICGLTLQKKSYARHLRLHGNVVPEICPYCNKEFREKRSLDKHIKAIHHAERPFACPIQDCNETFRNQVELKNHHNRHVKDYPFECDVCHMTFQKQDSLTTHYRSHTGEKPFVCEICDRSFTSEKNKKVHVQRHQGSLPHRCDVCGMTFQSRSHLIKHATR